MTEQKNLQVSKLQTFQGLLERIMKILRPGHNVSTDIKKKPQANRKQAVASELFQWLYDLKLDRNHNSEPNKKFRQWFRQSARCLERVVYGPISRTILGHSAVPTRTEYSALKIAVLEITKIWAQELAQTRNTINQDCFETWQRRILKECLPAMDGTMAHRYKQALLNPALERLRNKVLEAVLTSQRADKAVYLVSVLLDDTERVNLLRQIESQKDDSVLDHMPATIPQETPETPETPEHPNFVLDPNFVLHEAPWKFAMTQMPPNCHSLFAAIACAINQATGDENTKNAEINELRDVVAGNALARSRKWNNYMMHWFDRLPVPVWVYAQVVRTYAGMAGHVSMLSFGGRLAICILADYTNRPIVVYEMHNNEYRLLVDTKHDAHRQEAQNGQPIFLLQTATGNQVLHSQGICHYDLLLETDTPAKQEQQRQDQQAWFDQKDDRNFKRVCHRTLESIPPEFFFMLPKLWEKLTIMVETIMRDTNKTMQQIRDRLKPLGTEYCDKPFAFVKYDEVGILLHAAVIFYQQVFAAKQKQNRAPVNFDLAFLEAALRQCRLQKAQNSVAEQRLESSGINAALQQIDTPAKRQFYEEMEMPKRKTSKNRHNPRDAALVLDVQDITPITEVLRTDLQAALAKAELPEKKLNIFAAFITCLISVFNACKKPRDALVLSRYKEHKVLESNPTREFWQEIIDISVHTMELVVETFISVCQEAIPGGAYQGIALTYPQPMTNNSGETYHVLGDFKIQYQSDGVRWKLFRETANKLVKRMRKQTMASCIKQLKQDVVPTAKIDDFGLTYQDNYFTAKISKEEVAKFVRDKTHAYPALCYTTGNWDAEKKDDDDQRPELQAFQKVFFPQDRYITKLCKLVFRTRYAIAFLTAVECFQNEEERTCKDLQVRGGVSGLKWEERSQPAEVEDNFEVGEDGRWWQKVPETYQNLEELEASRAKDGDPSSDSNYLFVAAAEMQPCVNPYLV